MVKLMAVSRNWRPRLHFLAKDFCSLSLS